MKNLILMLVFSTLLSCDTDVFDCFDGEVITKELDLRTFHKLDIDMSAEVILQKGDVQKVTIEARKDLIADLESRSSVSDDIWKVRIKNFCNVKRSDVKIVMTVPGLKELSINGNVKVATESGLNNIASSFYCQVDGNASLYFSIQSLELLNLDINGNAKADLKGMTKELRIKVDGNSSIYGHDLEAKISTINIDGNATANVHVSDELNVSIDGNGTICYKGNPVITTKISGIGRIKSCN
ncbi:MAG: DUF2807 domain-containing protein [Saprospiraceae bacterium]|nr:DUF2807 domain-containing protein [Saprospiraceae bacterium]